MSATSSKLKNPNDSVMNQRVIKLAWPIFLQLLLGISLGYVDTIMLSNYNETAVGAIGNANQVLGFLTLAFNIISSATGIIVSQYLGAGKKEKMNMIYTVALSFNLVLSIVISFVVFIFSRNLLEAMQVPAAMLDESDMYMRIVGGTIFTQALINAFNSIFASNGKTVFGMINRSWNEHYQYLRKCSFALRTASGSRTRCVGCGCFHMRKQSYCGNCIRYILLRGYQRQVQP